MTNEEFIKSVSLEGEIWKDVVGYEGLYMVSSLGRVVSLSKRNGVSYRQPFIMKPAIGKRGGYLHIVLCVNNIKKDMKIHRIVAQAFIDNPNNYPHIDHINTNRLDNTKENLRWCTRSMNRSNPISAKRWSEARTGKSNTARSKPVVQLQNGIKVSVFSSQREASKIGFNQSDISACCRGAERSHKGYQWMYLSDYEALNQ